MIIKDDTESNFDRNNKEIENNVAKGLDFILHHLEEPWWPRTIATYTTRGGQIPIFNVKEALARFKQSNFLDCRINAYPDYHGSSNTNREAPNFIFAGDLDLCKFKSCRALKAALNAELTIIAEKLGGTPTVIWTGNGFHIYQPINGLILEQIDKLAKFDQPSRSFLRFAELYLSNGKSDQAHSTTVSFKNCMLRIPGTYNSKNIQDGEDAQVKIIQRWNMYRPSITFLLGSFYAHLKDQEITRIMQNQALKISNVCGCGGDVNTIQWIERLLQTPLHDHRKFSVWRIFAPYLTNIRRLSYDKSFGIINEYLKKCDSVRKLDFNANIKIRDSLRSAGSYRPISFDNLKLENRELHSFISDRMTKP